MCAQVGPQCCVVCRTAKVIGAQDGAKLCEVSGYVMVKRLKRLLSLLGVADAQIFTWKAFRSGRATEMAAMGFTLGQVLAAGDWHSVAMLKYIKESEADAAECLRQDKHKRILMRKKVNGSSGSSAAVGFFAIVVLCKQMLTELSVLIRLATNHGHC